MCDLKLSGLHSFDNMAIFCWVKNRSKTENQVVSWWDTNLWRKFCDPHWELVCCNKWHLGISEVSTPLEIAVGTHFHVWYGTKTTPVFLPGVGEASWLLLPSLVSLLSVQPGSTYSCILQVTGQVWESQKTMSNNTNQSYD